METKSLDENPTFIAAKNRKQQKRWKQQQCLWAVTPLYDPKSMAAGIFGK
jgi:hypothetical protein